MTALIKANIEEEALATTERAVVELALEHVVDIANQDHDDLDSEDDDGGTPTVFPAGSASDQVIGLREWAARETFPLRAPQRPSLPACEATTALQLSRDNLNIAANRVELVYEGRAWRLKDWNTLADLKQDGRPVSEVSLLPGMEISIAGRLFVAESARTIALRNFCSRLLGWGDDRLAAVDQALRAIRLAGSGRVVLVLHGSGDLVHVAQAIHRRAASEAAPFVVSDPRRRAVPATVRSPANCPLGIDAFYRACRGTLCVRLRRLPHDFDAVLRAFREPESNVQLVVCANAATARDVRTIAATQIQIPPLAARSAAEIERVVSEYVEDAIEILGAPQDCLGSRDIDWILERAAIATDLSIPDIEKAVFRLVAVKMAGTLSEAADMLGMAPVSLARWLTRRNSVRSSRSRRSL